MNKMTFGEAVVKLWIIVTEVLGVLIKRNVLSFLDVVFIAGLCCVWIGANELTTGAGTLVVGLLLLLYIKPLRRWW